jgi:hypothetical protein
MSSNGNPASRLPREANHVPLLGAASALNGVDPVVLYADPTTHALLTSGSGGGGGAADVQYVEGAITSPATGNVALGRYSATPPSLTDGKLSALQTDSSGNLKVAGTFSSTPPVDVAPSTVNITTVDVGSTTSQGANNQTIVTGTPTAGSFASFSISSLAAIRVQVSGAWTGTLQTEISVDGGTTWTIQGLHQGAYTVGSFTANFVGGGNLSGVTNFRVRATAAITGTATVKVTESANAQSVYVANAAPSGNITSVLNSSIATLTAGSTFTGTAEDASNFSEIRVSVTASHVSATDGLSIQQSPDGTNWDIADTYTIPATTGKTFAVPRQARWFRVVYTNGGTNQTSFRLQSILNRTGSVASSQRSQDAYSNENDLEQTWSFNSVWNGTTWDRMSGDTTGINVKNIVASALPTGAATSSLQTTGNSSLSTIATNTTNAATTTLQTAGNSSLTTIATNTGNGSTSANQTNGTQQSRITDGTNVANILKSDGTAAGQNSQITSGTYLSVPFSVTTVSMAGTTDAGNYRSVSVQITSQGTSSNIAFQVSNDNTNWINTALITTNASASSAITTNTTTNAIVYFGALTARYFRLNVTGISAGTTAGTIVFSTFPPVHAQVNSLSAQSGTWSVGSNSATGSAAPANAFYEGGIAQTANPSAATAGNLVGALHDKLGKRVVVGSIRDLKADAALTLTSTTTETSLIAAIAATFNDVYGLIVTNTSAAACEVVFRDALAGTPRFSISVPANDTRGFMLPESAAYKQTTVNTAWTAQCGTSVASIKISAMYVKNI